MPEPTPLTDAPEDDPVTSMLDDSLHAAVTAHHVPGAAAGIVVGDVRHVVGAGIGNTEAPRPVDGATLFQVGSITKTLTSAAVMVLVEEGRLALDDPVEQHLPGLGMLTGLDTGSITVEVALAHRSGFDGDHLFVAGAADGLAGLRTARRFFEPDTGWSYNNAGFSIAGEVVASAAGIPYEAFLRERLLGPLGMLDAGFSADEVITSDVSAPHWVFDGTAYLLRRAGWQPGWELTPLDRAAGGLVASVNHLLEWARFQWTGAAIDGSRILSEESLERLHRPVTSDVMPGESVALDWFVHDHDSDHDHHSDHDHGSGPDSGAVRTIEHGGTTVGYVSELLVAPGRRVGLVVLTNATNGAAVHQAVRRRMLPELLDVTEQDPTVDDDVDPDLERLLGVYEHAFATLTVTAGEQPGTLVVTPSARAVDGWQPPVTSPVTFGFAAENDVVGLDQPGPVKVARFDPDGDPAAWLLWEHRRAPRVDLRTERRDVPRTSTRR
ncbi:MAG: beta-lactamase family protein [Actinobacteria bacterium]|nr:beta-lactamase family protein [Actinomycetota bacterium]